MEEFQYNLVTLFADGGGMMYLLLLASLFGLGVIIAKGYVLTVAQRETRKVLDETEVLARQGRIEEAIQLAADTPGPVSAILYSGLKNLRDNRSGNELEMSINSTGSIELGFLERGLVALATVSTVAPLLGFLGTVWGMIAAFAAIEIAGQIEPGLVAGGIKIALLTTAGGLVIAIPMNIAYNFFVTRIDRLIIDMEQGANTILNIFWDSNKVETPISTAVGGGVAGTARPSPPAPDTDPPGSSLPDESDPPAT